LAPLILSRRTYS